MNILILSRKFDGVVGGVEKMVLLLAQQMYSRGHQVTVVSLDGQSAVSFYNWPAGVNWIKLNIGDPDTKSSIRIRLRRLFRIRNLLRDLRIDTVVGFQIGSFALVRLASMGMRINRVAAERNAPTLFNFIKYGQYKKMFSHLILWFADTISVQSEPNKRHYPRFLQSKIQVTPNPVSPVPIFNREFGSISSRKVILYIGRVTYQKNLAVLVNAMARLNDNPVLRIVGNGDQLHSVIQLARFLGVSIEVFDFTDDLSKFYFNADIFCLPSLWEGFPNVVGESLSHGLPVVAFEECAGVSSLIQDRVTGILAAGIDNVDSLTEALQIGLTANWDPIVIRKSIERYSMENFSTRWEQALLPIVPRRASHE